MKSSQRQIYAMRIERVVKHLESRTPDEGAPLVSELAEVAGMSDYHFHRVFRLMTGETVGAVTRRIRLARSLPGLAASKLVGSAADQSGYATTQGYARALRAQADTTASDVRSDASAFDALHIALTRNQKGTPKSAPAISIEVLTVDPFRLLAVRNVGAYEELNTTYGQLFESVLAQVPAEAISGIYGVPLDDTSSVPAAECRFDCGLAVAEGAEARGGLFELYLGGRACARLRHLGDYDLIQQTMDELYVATIAELDREIAFEPPFIHYLDDPEEVETAALRADIYLPLAAEEVSND